ncbi:MAG: hypothetical protein ACM3S4_07155 [Burkholderiales bacterium]
MTKLSCKNRKLRLLYGLPISVAIAYLLFRVQRSVLETPFTLP